MLNRLVYTKDKTVIELTKFKNQEAIADFSRAPDEEELDMEENYVPCRTWNGEPRSMNVHLNFQHLKSQLNGQDFDTLMGLPEIFINIVETRSDESGSLKKSKSDQKSFKTSDEIRMEDMKAHGDELPQYFATQLEKTYDEHLFSEATRDSMIKFVIKKIELTMTTLDSVPYLEAEIDELTFLAKVIGKLSKTYNLDIGSIKINRHQENPKFDQGVLARKSEAQNSSNQFFSSDYLTRSLTRTKDTSTSPILVLSSMYRLEGLTKMFHLNQTTLTVRGLTIDPNTNDYITWNVVNNLEMTVRPLKIALEMEIIQFINEYLFVREFNKIYNSLEKKEKAGRNNNRVGSCD